MKVKGYRSAKAGGALVTLVDDAGEERVLGLPKLFNGEARHSPDGFRWGYGGSGPAELSRAILIAFYPTDLHVRHPRLYQAFKADFIARLKADQWELERSVVDKWLGERPQDG